MEAKYKFMFLSLIFATMLITLSCSKSSFLNHPPTKTVHPLNSIDDILSLLDNEILFSQTHGLAILSADQFYFRDSFFVFLNNSEKSAYTWEKEIYQDQTVANDWHLGYKQVFYANLCLEALDKIGFNMGIEKHRYAMGAALFLRAYAFYNIAQVFAQPFEEANAEVEPGIPLRLSSDVSNISRRSSIGATYDQIIRDLQSSVRFLPSSPEKRFPNRPSKPAAFALLARMHVSMRNYAMALSYADSCLLLYDSLLDFKNIDPSLEFPFSPTNAEVLYQSRMFDSYNFVAGIEKDGCLIDSTLYNFYEPGDLRSQLYFRHAYDGKPVWKGSYYGNSYPFTGLATNEMYLIKAECEARVGHPLLAIQVLNTLLETRWEANQFTPLRATTANEALKLVLLERNKELVLRGERWTDLRRLNIQDTSITITRYVNGRLYSLSPNHKRYTLPIPGYVIQLSGMEQNPR